MRMLLTVLNTATRYAYARPLPNKKAQTVKSAMDMIFKGEYYLNAVKSRGKGKTKPLTGMRILRVDGGTEFKKDLSSYLKKKNIELEVSTEYRHNWLSRTNRFHRTLRGMIGDHFARLDTHRYVDVLQDIIENYNNRPHRTLSEIHAVSTSPAEAKEEVVRAHELAKLSGAREYFQVGVKVGDTVRLLMRQTKKGQTGKLNKKGQSEVWSRDTYTILEQKGPNTFEVDVPRGEIKIWPSYHLQVVSADADESDDQVSDSKRQRVSIEQVRRQRDLDRILPPDERKKNVIQQPVVTGLRGQTRTRRTQKPSQRMIDSVANS